MRRVNLETRADKSPDAIWSMLINIHDYPKYVKFVHKVESPPDLRIGDDWFDLSTIVFLPLNIKHTVTEMEPKRKLAFLVPLIFGGKMKQSFLLTQVNRGTDVRVEIAFDLGNPVFNQIIGPLLERRLMVMMNDTLKNLGRKIYERKDT